jgi:hypothetical protein
MKIISESLGRIVYIIRTDEVYPRKGVDIPTILDWIKDRYHFRRQTDLSQSPDPATKSNGIRFHDGVIALDEVSLTILDFTLYADGLVVTARNTDTSEAFLRDFLAAAAEHYEFRLEEVLKKRPLFLSELIVEFEGEFDSVIKNFEQISGQLNEALASTYGLSQPTRLWGVTFDFDKTTIPPPNSNLGRFQIERREGVPHTDRRYFARAPFRTSDHVRLLIGIEKAVQQP